jgi:SAM-dependent methyltransferase
VGVHQVIRVAMPGLAAAEAVAALGASLRLRLRRDGGAVDPALAARLDAVLDALGVREAVGALEPREAVAMLGLVEGLLGQAADFVARPGRTSWDHEDPSILMAQGHMSTLLVDAFRHLVVPSLGGGLAARMDAGAWCLDVGAGVAALSVALCRTWPALHVVGLEPWQPALALARATVAEAGLDDRIELRQETVEALQDADRYDLAWVPAFFISGAVLGRGIERVHAALRPDGCAVVGFYARPADPLPAAVADLRTVRQGGATLSLDETATLMARAGFADVEILVDTVWKGPVVFVIGRRAAR